MSNTSGRGIRGVGTGGIRRRRTVYKNCVEGISIGSIKRLGRRGGVKRISKLICYEIRDVLKVFLSTVIKSAMLYALTADRKTISANDVVHSLKLLGHTVYGFSL